MASWGLVWGVFLVACPLAAVAMDPLADRSSPAPPFDPALHELALLDAPQSPNCYKVRLLLSELRIPYIRVLIPLIWLKQSKWPTRSDKFAEIAPKKLVPALVIRPKGAHDFTGMIGVVEDSRVILNYLVVHVAPHFTGGVTIQPTDADGLTNLDAEDTTVANAKELWKLSPSQLADWEQQALPKTIGAIRALNNPEALNAGRFVLYVARRATGHDATALAAAAGIHLAKLNHLLERTGQWMTGADYSVVDIIMFGYISVVEDAGVQIQSRDKVHLMRWIQQMQEVAGYVDFRDSCFSKADMESLKNAWHECAVTYPTITASGSASAARGRSRSASVSSLTESRSRSPSRL